MSVKINTGIEWYERNQERLYKDFSKLLSFASISTDSAFKKDVLACAHWVEERLQKIGFSVEFVETPIHPIILARSNDWQEDRPTLLIYNHYDVQPIDPLELWNSPPFEAKIDGEKIIARGAQDNKGQLFYVLTAIEALYETKAPIGWNLLLFIEGEEECGSEGMQWLLKHRSKELKVDGALVVDLSLPAKNTPGITLGMRGLVGMEVRVSGATADLHSGMYGGIALNPAKALCRLIADLFDKNGDVTLKGFYDGIELPSQELRSLLDLSFDEKEAREEGVFAFDNAISVSRGITRKEANWFYPALEVNGIHSGYGGKGMKTIIPAKAEAKISCRIVKGQDANVIASLLEKYFLNQTLFPGLKVEVEALQKCDAVRVDYDSPIAQIAANAYSEVFGSKCQYRLSGATVPIGELAKLCNGQMVLMGMGLPEDGIHAPNESFGLDRLKQGFEIIYKILQKSP